MTSASDIITGAFRKMGIRASESPITSAEMSDGLEDLNDLGASYNLFPPVENASDTINVPRQLIGDLKIVLAEKMMSDYADIQINPVLAKQVPKAWNNIWRVTNGLIETKFPSTLPTGSGNQDPYLWDETFFPSSQVNF
jgi:hypothetical protein